MRSARTSAPFTTLLLFIVLMEIVVATGFAQGAGDTTDVHIAPRAKPEPVSAGDGSNVTTPSVGLKTTDRRIKGERGTA